MDVPQEYVCLPFEQSAHLQIWMTTLHADPQEVTHRHLFLGYSPLILGVIFPKEQAPPDRGCFTFTKDEFVPNDKWRGFVTDHRAVGRMVLKKIKIEKFGNDTVGFYRGVHADHRLINTVHQLTNNVKTRLRRKEVGNVSLPGNLYDQVRLAYAFPRLISLISLAQDGLMNCFPTDLHGKINDEFYVSSLRLGGNADGQVLAVKRVVLSQVKPDYFRIAYELGKNHMRNMRPADQFEMKTDRSLLFQVPVPAGAVNYLELEWVGSFDHGIHRIHSYRIVNRVELAQGVRLAHVHQYYAQWCSNQNKKLTLLIR